MKDEDYWEQITLLRNRLRDQREKILELTLGFDEEIQHEKVQKFHPLVFKLWEAVAHYKITLRTLEELEEYRFNQMASKKENIHNEYDPDFD